VLDLGSGSGEMLCTWARDYGVTGTGYRYEPIVLRSGEAPRSQLRVSDQVAFIHGDAAGYVAAEKVGVAACLGAT
jgi:cyclopropane fatty-acyl-phospholipid synthase-like methyltransferase